MVKNLLAPLKIEITNESSKEISFVPYHENHAFPVKEAGKVSFEVSRSEEAMYYERQAEKGLKVSLSGNASLSNETGSYDASTGEFTSGASFNYALVSSSEVEEDSVKTITSNYEVFGSLPYSAETPAIGMPAGNRFTVKFHNSEITSKSDLPSGNIVTVAVSDGTTISYSKNAFEDDGSLITIINAKNTSVLTVTVKWSSELICAYVFTFENAKLAAEGEEVEAVQDIEISLPATITLENISEKPVTFVPYKENFMVEVASSDKIIFTSRHVNEVLYYLLQANKDIKVTI